MKIKPYPFCGKKQKQNLMNMRKNSGMKTEKTCFNESLKGEKGIFYCSRCWTNLDIVDLDEEDSDRFYSPKYCPTCGAKVVEE